MTWYPIDNNQLPKEGEIHKIKVKNKTVCLVRDDDQLFATSVRCPHAGADLSGGWCENGRLICPYHRHAFDLRTGRGDPGQGNYIQTYVIEERDGKWFIDIPSGWLAKLFGK